MRTHLGCRGSVALGTLSEETQHRLEEVEATWLEFTPDPSRLEVRHVQPDAVSALREIGGELLEFLGRISESERTEISGGALYYLDEQTGQYIRLKVWPGGFLTLSWAKPDYARARWETYQGEHVAVVFEPYQCLNGQVTFNAAAGVREKIRTVLERPGGLYPQGEYSLDRTGNTVILTLRDVNENVLELVDALDRDAQPGTLVGDIEVTSFRAGDVDDYCRFAFLPGGEAWLVRPALWSDVPETEPSALEVAELVESWT
jgi:hypothetical protein